MRTVFLASFVADLKKLRDAKVLQAVEAATRECGASYLA